MEGRGPRRRLRCGPHSGRLENGVDVEQNPSPDLTERLVGSESPSHSLDYTLVMPLKRHVPTRLGHQSSGLSLLCQ